MWTPVDFDITRYDRKKVRFAFFHNPASGSDLGWYIDDVTVTERDPGTLDGFENGWDGWHVDNGVWQVGSPTFGPDSGHNSPNCAGTVLNGDYPGSNRISRLISSSIRLPDIVGDEELYLGFWHWFSYPAASYGGWVQIAVYDDANEQWSGWLDLSSKYINGESLDWAYIYFPLSDYARKKVKFAFYHSPASGSDFGWYLDDPRIINPCEADYDFDCDIDAQDLFIISDEYGFCAESCISDVEPNGVIDTADMAPLAIGFGKENCPTCVN
jgi:hypothetical protein